MLNARQVALLISIPTFIKLMILVNYCHTVSDGVCTNSQFTVVIMITVMYCCHHDHSDVLLSS